MQSGKSYLAEHCTEQHNKMLNFNEVLQKFVVLVLLCYFSWRVWQSGQKLFVGRVGNSVSKRFSEYRLYPSLSICFYMKDLTRENYLKDTDGHLQRLLDNVLIGFGHRNESYYM